MLSDDHACRHHSSEFFPDSICPWRCESCAVLLKKEQNRLKTVAAQFDEHQVLSETRLELLSLIYSVVRLSPVTSERIALAYLSELSRQDRLQEGDHSDDRAKKHDF